MEQAGSHLELLRVEWKSRGRKMNLRAGCRWITGGETKEGRGEERRDSGQVVAVIITWIILKQHKSFRST